MQSERYISNFILQADKFVSTICCTFFFPHLWGLVGFCLFLCCCCCCYFCQKVVTIAVWVYLLASVASISHQLHVCVCMRTMLSLSLWLHDIVWCWVAFRSSAVFFLLKAALLPTFHCFVLFVCVYISILILGFFF